MLDQDVACKLVLDAIDQETEDDQASQSGLKTEQEIIISMHKTVWNEWWDIAYKECMNCRCRL